MLRVDGRDVRQVQGRGGEQFTAFVDDLIRAEARGRLPDNAIAANLRAAKQDGGVDTEVRGPIEGEPTGRFRTPTVWQYKGTDQTNVGPLDHLIKDGKYCATRIAEGCAYRLCVCDELTAETKTAWEKTLAERVREISPSAPPPMVVTAGDLAIWASRHFGILTHYFYPSVPATIRSLDTWAKQITQLTEVFVPVKAWRPTWRRIEEHLDFRSPPPSIVISISGPAGVGKTRLAYEAVRATMTPVAYTDDDEDALRFANLCAGREQLSGVLVVDECTDRVRFRLDDVLGHCKDRVRVITIGSASGGYDDIRPQNRLGRLSSETVEAILAANYDGIPDQRRGRYAARAGGYVRFAAALCQHDALVVGVETGLPPGALNWIDVYLKSLVPDPDDRRVLYATALSSKVGWRESVASDLADLCELVGFDPSDFRDRANRLHERPGFIGRGGRFYYVTPKIVADLAFERAWHTWGRPDPEAFLARVPDSLQEQFLERVSESAPEAVREVVGRFFGLWAELLGPGDLSRPNEVKRLAALVEASPERYLPVLRALVERSPEEELRAVTGDSAGGEWGPRRRLVSLAEDMAAFPEYFADAEAILLRLSVAESEPSIANNATGTWKQLFRVALSGTAVPFTERLDLLEKRVGSEDDRVAFLALDALDAVIEMRAWRMVGASEVGGRIKPEEWRPQLRRDLDACLDSAVALLVRVAGGPRPARRVRARAIAMSRLWTLLLGDRVAEAKTILPSVGLSDDTQAQLINRLDDFLRAYRRPGSNARPLPAALVARVEEWLAEIQPADLHGRLLVLVAPSPFGHLGREEEGHWREALRTLASECLREPQLLECELSWLSSEEAQGAPVFGESLGREDQAGSLLDMIFEAALHNKGSAVARGYTFGLLTTGADQAQRLNDRIDKLEDAWPEGAYEVFMMGAEVTNALERALRLVDSGRLPVTRLGGFSFGGARHGLGVGDVQAILLRLADAVEAGDRGARRVAVELIGFRLHREQEESLEPIIQSPETRALVWRVIEGTTEDAGGEEYQWARILSALAEEEPARATRAAVKGLVGDGVSLHRDQYLEKLLASIAARHPEVVMEEIGRAMLDPERGWRFSLPVRRDLITSLPEQIVVDWLKEHGVAGARQLATHLPPPCLGADGRPVVPSLTEFVLSEFGQDDATFHGFCAGVHNLQMYGGDIAAQHEEEAELAERFVNHSLPRIRQWARYEIESSREQARRWREREEEERIE